MATLESELEARLERWRAEGQRVVFTNGVFDILHYGHVVQLTAARGFGDVLLVGVNSDASARGLGKGSGRPVLDQHARCQMLLALRCVDAVALFDEPTPLELIKLVRPAVLVKGGDYSVSDVVGHDFVTTYGGRVEIVPLVPGYSTTEIIRRIRSAS